MFVMLCDGLVSGLFFKVYLKYKIFYVVIWFFGMMLVFFGLFVFLDEFVKLVNIGMLLVFVLIFVVVIVLRKK